MKKIFFLLFFPLWTWAQTDLILSIGQKKILTFTSGSVWIQDKKIVKAQVVPGGVQLVGLQTGETTVQLGSKLWSVQVIHPTQFKVFENFEHLSQQIPGLQVTYKNGQVALIGELYRWKDWKKIAQYYKSESQTYSLQTKISPSSQRQFQSELNQLLESYGLRPQKFLFNEKVQLRLPQKHPDLDLFKKILRPFGIEIYLDAQQLISAPTLRIKITVAEVQRNHFQSWGIDWPTELPVQVFPQWGVHQDPIDAQIRMLETTGKGRILASPNLICQSGEEAEFLAGGEFPIQVINYKQRAVVWKKYGISLKVKPTTDSSGRIHLKIDSEVSDITGSSNGIPILSTHKVSSVFDLLNSKTVVLSGLLKEQSAENQQGLPWLSRIPILGSLFSSQDYLQKKTELLVFVRPQILNDNNLMETDTSHLGKIND